MLHLHYKILPPEQKDLLEALAWTKSAGFVLYGGTALALQYGHRISVDFDFFSSEENFPIDEIICQFGDYSITVEIQKKNTVILSVNGVQVSFFSGISGRVAYPYESEYFFLASPVDIMMMKFAAIMNRACFKDYYDIATMLNHGANGALALSGFIAKHGKSVSASNVLNALCYFDDGDIQSLKQNERFTLVNFARITAGMLRHDNLPQVELIDNLSIDCRLCASKNNGLFML